MSETNLGADAPRGDGQKKVYTRPTLTEYGSVAKLTMVKGTTQVEGTPNLKKTCL